MQTLIPFLIPSFFPWCTFLTISYLYSLKCSDISIIFATLGLLFTQDHYFPPFPTSLFFEFTQTILVCSPFPYQLDRGRQSLPLVNTESRDKGWIPPCREGVQAIPATLKFHLLRGISQDKETKKQQNGPRACKEEAWILVLVPRALHYITQKNYRKFLELSLLLYNVKELNPVIAKVMSNSTKQKENLSPGNEL